MARRQRKYIKMRMKVGNEIRKLFNTIINAHHELLGLWKRERIQDVFMLLTQCQECAIEIGKTIDEQEGKGTEIVSHLEDYCEQLYCMTQLSDLKQIEDGIRHLDISVQHMRQDLEDRLKETLIKVVFMPYKASMWDCMESIWEAAQADPGCQACVVPLPFFEKDARGNIAELCYEGEKFPAHVPVIHYREFRLETERPDVIYIHNPYDGANFVTSVDPEYYSANLKRYTDLLVYIPYYITGRGFLPAAHQNLPAYDNADFIILQDEMKKISLQAQVPEEKLLVLGNPKIDYLNKLMNDSGNLMKNVIPSVWRKKFSGRKVFLYNVSISGILENSTYAIKKIRYVLSVFADREDVVLLWRPHPLIAGTLKSMRPELYAEYMEIKKEFLNQRNGILDETADAAVSAVVADAYIGEMTSSMVHYFGILGKPVYFIDWQIIASKTGEGLLITDCVYQKPDVYFVPRNPGIEQFLLRFSTVNGSFRIERLMCGELLSFEGWGSYCGIAQAGQYIVLCPYNTNEVYLYNKSTDNAVKIVLRNFCTMMFDKIITYHQDIYLIPKTYPALVKISIRDFSVKEYAECLSSMLPEQKGLPAFAWAVCRRKNYLYMASVNEPKLLKFNMDTEEYSVMEIGELNYGFYSMVYDGTDYWLAASKNNSVIQWNEESGEYREFTYPIPDDEYVKSGAATILDDGEFILIFHSRQNEVIKMSKRNGIVERIVILPHGNNNEQRQGGYTFSTQLDERFLLAFRSSDNCLVIRDRECGWKAYPFQLETKEKKEMKRHFMNSQKIHRGTPYYVSEKEFCLNDFLDCFSPEYDLDYEKERDEYHELVCNMEENAGSRINQYILNILKR